MRGQAIAMQLRGVDNDFLCIPDCRAGELKLAQLDSGVMMTAKTIMIFAARPCQACTGIFLFSVSLRM